jgi:hypothetical protein
MKNNVPEKSGSETMTEAVIEAESEFLRQTAQFRPWLSTKLTPMSPDAIKLAIEHAKKMRDNRGYPE